MKLNIVLFEPEIPENTGNISRSCVGFNAKLHLIRPFGFILDDKRMKRAGLDYWDFLIKQEYDNWDDFESKNILNRNSKIFLITKFGEKKLSDLENKDFENFENIYFVFGKETKGLSSEIMKKYENNQRKINMNSNIRSFNLSNTVAIVSHHFHYLTKFKYI